MNQSRGVSEISMKASLFIKMVCQMLHSNQEDEDGKKSRDSSHKEVISDLNQSCFGAV